jgi:6-phosphogluconolactonase
MAEASPVIRRRIDRRIVLQAAAAMAAAGPELLRGGHAEAQPRASVATLFAYVGAFTTPERKGHGGGINVYRVDSASGAWSHVQLVEIVNPSFLALDRAQRFLYAVHADLDEVSAYTIDKQTGRITALNRQSCGGKNPVHLSIDRSLDHHRQLRRRFGRCRANREGRYLGAARRSGHPAR